MLKKTSGMGWLGAASLAVTLATFGCTSNQYAGNGQPTRAINSGNHSTTYGSSSGTEGTPKPMASSYSSPVAPRVNTDALAILAADRGFRGYVLGPVNPGGVQQGATVVSGQFESPANAVLPQETVNSSINSQATPAITGGDVATVSGTTAAASPIPTLMNSTPAPQATGTTGVAATSSPIKATTTRTTAATSALRTTTATGTGSVRGGIQLQTSASGNVVMTNVAVPAVKGSSNK